MNATILTTATFAILSAAAATAQNGNGLLYSTLVDEQSNQCASTPGLNLVRDNSLQYVEPVPHPVLGVYPYESKAYMPGLGYNTVAGDVDCDGNYFDPTSFDGVDASLHPRDMIGVPTQLDKTRVFISGQSQYNDVYGNFAAPGDVWRFRTAVGGAGSIEYFLTEQDARNAFGIAASDPFNIDAITIGRSTPGAIGFDIILSVEDDVMINVASVGSMFVEDGAILMIPSWAVGVWNVAADGAVLVGAGSVAPNTGMLLATEPDVDAWVGASNISNHVGAPAGLIGDVDGLANDPWGTTWFSTWATTPAPDLLISGEMLTGAGVISTQGGGQIGVVNSMLGLPAPFPTSGLQVGLITTGGVHSLDALALTRPNLSHFTMDSPTEQILGAGPMTIEIGGGDPAGPPALVLIDLGSNLPCGFDPATFPGPINPDFPHVYPTTVFTNLPINPNGTATFTLPISAGLWNLFNTASVALEFQAYQGTFTGLPGKLSNPIRVQFY